MITKGIIKTIEQGGNTCTVRLPLFEMSSKKEVLISAIISAQPGVINNYKEEDIVLVDFENNKIDQPIVIGKLYLGAVEEAKTPRGTINCEELNVNTKASLPLTTKLVFKGDSSTNINVDGGLSTYKTIADIIEALQKTDQKFNENSIDLDSQIAKIETVYAQIDSRDIVDAQKITNWSITMPDWKENYFIWQKTTCYNRRGQILGEPELICLDGITSGVYALAQGKTTNYYSDKDPRESGHKLKEGDCWFQTITPDSEEYNDEYDNDSDAAKSPQGILYQWDGSQWQDVGGELVANKLTANYINALNITAKKITVIDENVQATTENPDANIIFRADSATKDVKIAGFNVDKDSLYGGELEKLNNVKFNVVEPIKENDEYVSNKILSYDEWRTLDYPDNTWSEALNGNDATDLKKMYYSNYCTYTFTANDGTGNTSNSKAIRSFTKTITISDGEETIGYSKEEGTPDVEFKGLLINLNQVSISEKINTDRVVINTSIYLGINSPTNTENPNSTEDTITDPTYNYVIATKPFKKTAEVTIDTIIASLFNSNTGEINTDSNYEVAGRATGPFTSGALNNLTRVDYFDLKPDDTIAIIYVNTQYNKHTTVVSNEDTNTYYEYEYDSSGNIVNKIEYSSGTSISTVTNYLDECYCIIPKELAINFTTLEIGPNFKVSSSGSLLNKDATFYNNLTSNGTTYLGGFTFENNTLTSPTLTINNTGLHLPIYKTLHLNCSCKDDIANEGLTIGINSKQTHKKVLDEYVSTTGNQLEPVYWLKNTITSPSIIEISSNPERDYTTDLNTTSIKLWSAPKRDTIVEQLIVITPTNLNTLTSNKGREVTLTFRYSVQTFIPPSTLTSASACMNYTIPIYFHTSIPGRRGYPPIYSIKQVDLVIKKGPARPRALKLLFTIPLRSSVIGISFDKPQAADTPTYTNESINNSTSTPITATFTRFYAPINSYEPTIELKANKIQTTGDIYANNCYTSSDFNLKDNIINLDNSQLNNFYKDLNPVSFNFKDNPTIEHVGFIAQEIAKTYENFFNKKLGEYSLVTKDDKTNLYSINYSNLTALNSAQIKNLILKLEDLEQKYEKLQKKYDLLVGKKDENT